MSTKDKKPNTILAKFDSCTFGEVTTVKCDTVFEALYAVKRRDKVYRNPVFKWKMRVCNENNNTEDTQAELDDVAIKLLKTKMGCDSLSCPQELQNENFAKARKHLRMAKIQIIDENKKTLTPPEEVDSKCKHIIYKKGKWHAVLIGNLNAMDKKEMRELEDDFTKHMVVLEKKRAKDAESTNKAHLEMTEFVRTFLAKNSKNLERVQRYEQTVKDVLKEELEREYLDKHADRRFKPLEKNLNTDKFKKWFKKEMKDRLKRLTQMTGGTNPGETSPMEEGEVFYDQSITRIYDDMANYYIDHGLITNLYNPSFEFDDWITNVDSILSAGVDMINLQINEEKLNPSEQRNNKRDFKEVDQRQTFPTRRKLLRPSSVAPVTPVTPVTAGGQSGGNRIPTDKSEVIRFKIFQDLYHDFDLNPIRNPLGADNRDFEQTLKNNTSSTVKGLGTLTHMDEDRYFHDILLNKSYDELQNFTVQTKHNLGTDPSQTPIVQAINTIMPSEVRPIILEDMPISSDFKTQIRVDSKHTYTNILDPITSIKDDNGATNKSQNMYPYSTTSYPTVEKLSTIITEFYQSVFKNVESFEFKELFNYNFDDDDNDPNYNHFKVEIKFSTPGTYPLTFNIYGGMFTVVRINYLIHAIKEENILIDADIAVQDTGFETFIEDLEIKERKIMRALRKFYIMLKTKLGLNNQADRILFIQMMKTFGDHGQIYEFDQLLQKAEGAINTRNILFASKDRIIVAEAVRLNCPCVFELQGLRKKIPLEVENQVLSTPTSGLSREFNQDKVFFFYSAGLTESTTIDVGALLKENGIIAKTDTDQFVYNKQGNGTYFTTGTYTIIDGKQYYSGILGQFVTPTPMNGTVLKDLVKKLVMYIAADKQVEHIIVNSNYVSRTQKRIKDMYTEWDKYNKIYTQKLNEYKRTKSPRRLPTILDALTKMKIGLDTYIGQINLQTIYDPSSASSSSSPTDTFIQDMLKNMNLDNNKFVDYIKTKLNDVTTTEFKRKYINFDKMVADLNLIKGGVEALIRQITETITPSISR